MQWAWSIEPLSSKNFSGPWVLGTGCSHSSSVMWVVEVLRRKVSVTYTPTASLQLQLRLQWFCNRRLLLPNRFPNCGQPVLQALAAPPCGTGFLETALAPQHP